MVSTKPAYLSSIYAVRKCIACAFVMTLAGGSAGDVRDGAREYVIKLSCAVEIIVRRYFGRGKRMRAVVRRGVRGCERRA